MKKLINKQVPLPRKKKHTHTPKFIPKMNEVVLKPHLKLLFCLSRGDRRFEKPGRKDPGMILLLCVQKMGGRRRGVFWGRGLCVHQPFLTVSGVSLKQVYQVFVVLCCFTLNVFSALLFFCLVFTIRYLHVLGNKSAASRFCLFNQGVMSIVEIKLLHV